MIIREIYARTTLSRTKVCDRLFGMAINEKGSEFVYTTSNGMRGGLSNAYLAARAIQSQARVIPNAAPTIT